MTRFVLALTVAVTGASAAAADDDPLALFEQRIMPIFRSPNPSSCVQCHLSSVDLKDYILPSHERTFVSLRDQGLINLDKPEQSKILTLIGMGDRDPDKVSRLIHSKTRKAEHEAFAAWVKACCNDERLRNLPAAETAARPERPDEVIRHNRKDRVLDSFVRNIWSQRMRCFPCHTPHELDPDNPKHATPIKRQRELVEKFGPKVNIFRESPQATMKALIASSRKVPEGRLPLLNLDDPAQSLMLLKPTSKLPAKDADGSFQPPSSSAPVSHMGGLKMHVDDQSYKSFIGWIKDYSQVVRGEYASAEDLPSDNWIPTQHVLRMKETPEKWAPESRVQLFVHAWNPRQQQWVEEPIAFTQGTVTPRGFVNGMLFLLARDGVKRPQADARLPRGKYLVKAYVDDAKRLAEDPTVMLGKNEFAGQLEVQTQWGQGFRQATVVSGAELKH